MKLESTLPEPVAHSLGAAPRYDRDDSIAAVFSRQAKRSPDRIAVQLASFSYEPSLDKSLTFRELDELSNQLAQYLRHRGVGAESRVGLSLERGLDLIVTLLGILKSGAAYVPVDPSYPAAHLANLAAEAGLTLTISDSRHSPELRRILPCPVVSFDAERHAIASESTELLSANETPHGGSLAYILFTSGSTGEPKGVLIPHRGVTRLVLETNYVCLGESETVLQLAPLSFDASTFEIWGPLLTGGRLVMFPPGLPQLDQVAQVVRSRGVTTMWLAAGLFHRMVELQPDGLKPLRQLLAGGDVLSAKHLREAFWACPGITIINGYGPTECTTFAACHPMRAAIDVEDRVPIGRPIAQTSIFILTADGRLAGPGQFGEICIGGDGLADSYLNDARLTASKFVWISLAAGAPIRLYRTGDQGLLREDGIIEFHGRLDRQVKISGHRLEPSEIESALRRYEHVIDAAVVAVDGERGERRLAAFVVLRSVAPPQFTEKLRAYLQNSFPAFMVPSVIRVLDRLPLNANGKVDRRSLEQEIVASQTSTNLSSSNGTEARIAAIWQRVLEISTVPVNANFFDLGGDSLLLIEVHAAMQKAGFRSFSITDLFAYPTVAALAAQLDKPDELQSPAAEEADTAGRRRARERARVARVAQ